MQIVFHLSKIQYTYLTTCYLTNIYTRYSAVISIDFSHLSLMRVHQNTLDIYSRIQLTDYGLPVQYLDHSNVRLLFRFKYLQHPIIPYKKSHFYSPPFPSCPLPTFKIIKVSFHLKTQISYL